MTAGDAAAAVGMSVVPMAGVTTVGSGDVREGAAEINTTRDYLAAHQTSGTHDAAAITSGTLALARIPTITLPKVSLGGGTLGVDAIAVGGTGAGVDSAGNATLAAVGASGRITNPYGRANSVSSFVTAGFDPSGNLGVTTSSKRFKENIAEWAPEERAFLALQVVGYTRIEDGSHEVGMIAEALDDLGLTDFVFYEDDGRPLGIHYERIALLIIPAVQGLLRTRADHEARLAEIERRINA